MWTVDWREREGEVEEARKRTGEGHREKEEGKDRGGGKDGEEETYSFCH